MRRQNSDNEVKIARAYVRVSLQRDRGKGEGKGEFLSPDLQLDRARAYVKAHLPDYEFDEGASKAHMDIDRSASRLKWQKREGLVAHLEAARRGEFSALVFFKLSRFARNAKEGLELFDKFEEAGCSVHSVMDNINTTTAVGKMVRTILLAIAEMESDNISEWVTEAFLKRVERGFTHGKPYFWLTKNGDGQFELNDRAKDIRRLVDLRLEGHSNIAIARTLNEEGFRSSTGCKWTEQRVAHYLLPDKLRALQGHFVYGRKREEGDPRRIILENVFPSIIAPEEAETILAFNRQQREVWGGGNPRKAVRTTYVLSGLVWCAHCGTRLRSRSAGKGGIPSYACRDAATSGVDHSAGVSVVAEGLEDAALRVVREAVADYQEQMEKGVAPKPKLAPAASSLERQIAKATDAISRLSALYESGHMDLEDFDRRYRELTDEREKLRERLKETDSGSLVRTVVEQATTGIADGELTPEIARRLLLAFIQKVEAPVKAERPEKDGKLVPCRAAWVTLKLPLQNGVRRILAPIYTKRYKGYRVLLDME